MSRVGGFELVRFFNHLQDAPDFNVDSIEGGSATKVCEAFACEYVYAVAICGQFVPAERRCDRASAHALRQCSL